MSQRITPKPAHTPIPYNYTGISSFDKKLGSFSTGASPQTVISLHNSTDGEVFKKTLAEIVTAIDQHAKLQAVAESHANLLKMIESVGLRPAGIFDIKVGVTLEAAQHAQDALNQP